MSRDVYSILSQAYEPFVPTTAVLDVHPHLTCPLLEHQQTMVQGMKQHYDRLTQGYSLQLPSGDLRKLKGNLGIIADPPGTGKTLAILAYMAETHTQRNRMVHELTPTSTTHFYSEDQRMISEPHIANLILVPHSLFQQWRTVIDTCTTLPYVAIETKRSIQPNHGLEQRMVEAAFVLTTNTCYKFVDEFAQQHHLQWNQVVVDEATSIYFTPSSDPPLRFQFLWLIAAQWHSLLFKSGTVIHPRTLLSLQDGQPVPLPMDLFRWLTEQQEEDMDVSPLVSTSYLKDILPFHHPHRGYLVLRNTDRTLHTSLSMRWMPPLQERTHPCRPTLSLHSFIGHYLASPHITRCIEARDVPRYYQALRIDCIPVEEYIHQQQTTKPPHKIALMKRKVGELECSICLEPITSYRTILDCCYHMFCGPCMLNSVLTSPRCPICRDTLTVQNMTCLTALSEEEKNMGRTKMETCIDLFRQNRDMKCIVYSSFDNIYYQLFEEMDRVGVKAERIENNLFSLRKTIRNYCKGTTQVLFVSNVEALRGLSLTCTTHLIFYHELPAFSQRQILIHSAQRVGRSAPLQVIHLNSSLQMEHS